MKKPPKPPKPPTFKKDNTVNIKQLLIKTSSNTKENKKQNINKSELEMKYLIIKTLNEVVNNVINKTLFNKKCNSVEVSNEKNYKKNGIEINTIYNIKISKTVIRYHLKNQKKVIMFDLNLRTQQIILSNGKISDKIVHFNNCIKFLVKALKDLDSGHAILTEID